MFYIFLVNKTEPKFKCIFNDLCIKKFQDKIFIFCMLQVLCTVNSIKKLEVASSLGSKDTNIFPNLEKPTIALNI